MELKASDAPTELQGRLNHGATSLQPHGARHVHPTAQQFQDLPAFKLASDLGLMESIGFRPYNSPSIL